VNCYDLQIKVVTRENQVKLFHQTFCKWYLKVREVDAQVTIYPWAEKIREEEDIIIENPMDIPTVLPLLKKFVHSCSYKQQVEHITFKYYLAWR